MNGPRQVVVGVPADEGLPEQVMATIADDLPGVFAAQALMYNISTVITLAVGVAWPWHRDLAPVRHR
jgi:hypothetical protein